MTTYVEPWDQSAIQGIEGFVARTAFTVVLTGSSGPQSPLTGQLWPLTRASA